MSKQKNASPTSYRLPEKVKILITILAEKLLISKTDIITLAILDLAKKEDVMIKEKKDVSRT